jgi:hypothetical protein
LVLNVKADFLANQFGEFKFSKIKFGFINEDKKIRQKAKQGSQNASFKNHTQIGKLQQAISKKNKGNIR